MNKLYLSIDEDQSGNTTNFGMAYLRYWRKHSIYL